MHVNSIFAYAFAHTHTHTHTHTHILTISLGVVGGDVYNYILIWKILIKKYVFLFEYIVNGLPSCLFDMRKSMKFTFIIIHIHHDQICQHVIFPIHLIGRTLKCSDMIRNNNYTKQMLYDQLEVRKNICGVLCVQKFQFK